MQHTKSDAEAEKLGGGRVAHEVPEGCKVIRKSDEPLLGTSYSMSLLFPIPSLHRCSLRHNASRECKSLERTPD